MTLLGAPAGNAPLLDGGSKPAIVGKLLLNHVAVDELRQLAIVNTFNPANLEPDLSIGLARDGVTA
jgi:hypothetical protein